MVMLQSLSIILQMEELQMMLIKIYISLLK